MIYISISTKLYRFNSKCSLKHFSNALILITFMLSRIFPTKNAVVIYFGDSASSHLRYIKKRAWRWTKNMPDSNREEKIYIYKYVCIGTYRLCASFEKKNVGTCISFVERSFFLLHWLAAPNVEPVLFTCRWNFLKFII